MSQQYKLIKVFNPYPWQLEVLRDMSKIILLDGGAGGGKSRVIGEKIHAYMKKYPGSTGLILRKNREVMTNSTILMLEREVIGDDPSVVHKSHKHRFEYGNGSVLAYGGMKDESQREGIRSIGQKGAVDILWYEEANAFIEEDYNEGLARMRGNSAPWRQVILSTNADSSEHWINKRLILKEKVKRFISFASDNPINDQEYIDTLDSLTGVQRDRLSLGKWIKSEGVIYKDFNAKEHVIEEGDLLPEPYLYKGFIAGADSNYPRPRSCLLIGIRGDGRRDIIDEFYVREATIEDMIEWLEDQSVNVINRVIDVYHDPSDPQSITKINASLHLRCYKANNSVLPGISTVAGCLKNNKLFIVSKCVNLIRELHTYAWKRGREEDAPEKKDDHAVDSLRYALHSEGPKVNFAIGSFIG